MKWSRQALAESVSPDMRDLRGAIRRMAIRFTDGVLWQLTGHTIDSHRETVTSEVFGGVGFYSRPRAASKTAEAILVRIGDAMHTAVIATRDEALRKLWKAVLDANPDVTAMFNSLAGVIIKSDGTIEARSRAGVAVALAKASELESVANDVYSHIHVASGSPTSKPVAEFSLPDPPGAPLVQPDTPGTEVIKGE